MYVMYQLCGFSFSITLNFYYSLASQGVIDYFNPLLV